MASVVCGMTVAATGYPNGSDFDGSVTKIVGIIASETTRTVDIAIDVVDIRSDGSILKRTAGEARSSNSGVWREASFDTVVTHTKAAIVVVAMCYARSSDGVRGFETLVDIISSEDEARILHGLACMFMCPQGRDSVVAMTMDSIGSRKVVSTVVTEIAVLHMGWINEVSPDVQVEKMFRGK